MPTFCVFVGSPRRTPVAEAQLTQGRLPYIYLSSDSGASWTETGTPQNWKAVALSADGTKVVAVVDGGYIYTWNGPLP